MNPQSILLLILVLTTSSTSGRNFDTSKIAKNSTSQPEVTIAAPLVDTVNDTKSDDLNNRIGLTVHRGQAHAIAPNGARSGAQAIIYNYQVGILRPGLAYQPLYDRTGGQASSYSTGPVAPHTWAGARYNNGKPGGGSYSGYQGGRGSASADSYSQVQKILLNPFDGTTLYSNLKIPTNATTKEQNQTLPLSNTNNTEENLMEVVKEVKIVKKETEKLILV